MTGAIRANRSRIWAGAVSPVRAARSWADRHRLTAWSMCAGHALDFDTWEEMGAAGWGYRHVLPYFKRMETSHGGQDGWRGDGGPLHVSRGRRKNPLYEAFVEAGREAGYQTTADCNGEQQEGFGDMEMTVWNGPSLVRRQRLFEACACTRKSFQSLTRSGAEDPVRRPPGDRG